MLWLVENLWLIPALPLLAAGLSAPARQHRRLLAAALAIGAMVLAFFLSCAAFVSTLGRHGDAARQVHNFDWFALGETMLQLGWVLDPLTAAMLVMVSFVGLLIFIYSVAYMARDENFTRFFCFMSLFAAAMLGLVVANSLLLLFMCWELVGLASYLLIGFWYQKPSAAAAAKKAFITTRIGDVLFFLGMLWLYAETGTLLFYDGGQGCLEQTALGKLVGQTTFIGMGVSTAVALLILGGAVGKSGQVPLHVWLPDAMEGPTPVSALIHAATMVAAGVFLVARVYPLMEAGPQGNSAQLATVHPPFSIPATNQTLTPALSLSEREQEKPAASPDETKRLEPSAAPLPRNVTRGGGPFAENEHGSGNKPPLNSVTTSTALKAVTWLGAITALFAALIAVAQTDIKRILAYSTVSQLGFMFLGLGAGGVAVGMFHLLTHAFFKALLFLGAGSVIHGCHEEQDIRFMGGLRRFMPVTFAAYAVGMMALSGVPLLFSGFWSKDEILHAAFLWSPSKWPFFFGICGAFLTAFYMTRQVYYVFFGTVRRPSSSDSHGTQGNSASASSHDLRPALSFHESPPVMTMPLVVLAVCTVGLSLFGTPAWPWFHSYLSGHGGSPEMSGVVRVDTVLLMLFSAAIALGGIGVGWWLYSSRPVGKAEDPDPLERLQPAVFGVLRDKFYIDELYQVSVVRFNAWSAGTARWLDDCLWSRAVMVVAYLVLALSWANRLIDEFIVNFGFDRGCNGFRFGARLLSLWQNGQVQRYLRVLALALAAFALLFIWGCRG